jgi:hypothetical protein
VGTVLITGSSALAEMGTTATIVRVGVADTEGGEPRWTESLVWCGSPLRSAFGDFCK